MQKMSYGALAWDVRTGILSSASMGKSVCVTPWHSRHFMKSCGKQRNRERWSFMKTMTRRTSGLKSSGSALFQTT
ncbi:hypothetical protein FR483_n817L [Paramecium bursaria Chlorella virus FR483]|uniref:Uncharacterized protein n817L n=1 Tax=Paramecium bursaria Chlorella virus FR483 TaxID=399781 RepID=A7J8H1_PBCVF|nr:hypothetical protein FR483_n817L [Paramecium bursaria Chlorella virus FR483]ABT16102.1 hypothetical protein FR483_n817L [Paramecium bursaria Chlorella virus FR483]